MSGTSSEAYLLLPFCCGVLGLLQKLRLKEFALWLLSESKTQSWMVQEKKGPYRSQSFLCVTGLASCFSCHDNCFHCWGALPKEGGIHTLNGFIACCVVKKLRPKLCYTPGVSLPLQYLDMQENCVFLGLGTLDKSVFYVTNFSQVKMLFLTLLVKYSTHQTNALIRYIITWHRTRLTNLGKNCEKILWSASPLL